MRRLLALALLAFVSGTLGLLAPAPARSCSCVPPGNHGEYAYDSPTRALDLSPWVSVNREDVARFLATDCQLVGDGAAIALTAEAAGDGGSLESQGGCAGIPDDQFTSGLVRFTPAAPLAAGARYELACDDAELQTRSEASFLIGDEPAPPPPEIAAHSAERFPYACCGESGNDRLAFKLEGTDDAFFRRGGLVEVAYPDGRVDWIGDLGYLDPETRPEAVPVSVELPPASADALELTPVNAAGARGEAVTLPIGGLGGPREFGCEVSRRRDSLGALAALLVLCLFGQTRRRRGPPR
ncbi:MAG: hypothetical protein R3A51_13770 [Nannocystaceae bacterium]